MVQEVARTLDRPELGAEEVLSWIDHGGASEVLESMFPQGLVPANNIDETVSLIKKFIANPPNVRQQQIYTLESMQNKTLSLYKSLVQ